MMPSIAPHRRALLGSVILAAGLLAGALHPGHAAAIIGGSRGGQVRIGTSYGTTVPARAIMAHSAGLSNGRGSASSVGKP